MLCDAVRGLLTSHRSVGRSEDGSGTGGDSGQSGFEGNRSSIERTVRDFIFLATFGGKVKDCCSKEIAGLSKKCEPSSSWMC